MESRAEEPSAPALRRRGKAEPDVAVSGRGCKNSSVLEADELPEWAHRYTYITSGYRDPALHNSWILCLTSIFKWHTETVNILLHLLGSLYALGLLFWVLTLATFQQGSPVAKLCSVRNLLAPRPPSPPAPRALNANILSARPRLQCYLQVTVCLGSFALQFCSTVAHTFHVLSPVSNKLMWRLDYVAMSSLFLSAELSQNWIVLGVYSPLAFWCVQAAFLTTTAVIMWQIWTKERYGLIGIIAVWGLVPQGIYMAYLAYGPGGGDPNLVAITFYALAGTGFAAGGCLMYALHIPERWMPGRLNYVGNSHNFLHLGVPFSTTFALLGCQYIAAWEQSVWNK